MNDSFAKAVDEQLDLLIDVAWNEGWDQAKYGKAPQDDEDRQEYDEKLIDIKCKIFCLIYGLRDELLGKEL